MKLEQNHEIRELMRRYNITHADILPYLSNFSHKTRISEELAKPLPEHRKKAYLLAIKKVKEEYKMLYSEED